MATSPTDCAVEVFAPGEVSLPGRSEYRLALAPDGRTAWFHVDTPRDDGPPDQAIWVARRHRRRWVAEVAPFSGVWRDSDPFVAPDGGLYFSSNRPVTGGVARADTDLWVVRGDGSAPVWLGDAVNTDHDELYPSVTADGTLFWGSDADGGRGGWDVYSARRDVDGYGAPVDLGPAVNTDHWEFNPWVSPDGDTLLFVGLRRPDGVGLGDVFRSRRVDGEWQPAELLPGPVNTPGDDFHPTLGPDRRLYLVRQVWDPFTPSDLYVVDARCVGL